MSLLQVNEDIAEADHSGSVLFPDYRAPIRGSGNILTDLLRAKLYQGDMLQQCAQVVGLSADELRAAVVSIKERKVQQLTRERQLADDIDKIKSVLAAVDNAAELWNALPERLMNQVAYRGVRHDLEQAARKRLKRWLAAKGVVCS